MRKKYAKHYEASEDPAGLLRDLSRIGFLLLLIFVLPAAAVLPFTIATSETNAYEQSAGDLKLCESDDDSQACRPIEYDWRSGWLDWRARWLLPEVWVQRSIQEANAAAGAASRERESVDDLQYWSDIYVNAAKRNRPRVRVFAQGFSALAHDHGLSRRRTLELAAGFVQSLEYAIPENYLQLYAPPRLLALGRGDCDSRSLFLALLLEDLGYDAVLLLSPHYRHAMVGVRCEWCEGPRYRDPKNGVAYSFLETTARTPPGFVHPAVEDVVYWHALRLR